MNLNNVALAQVQSKKTMKWNRIQKLTKAFKDIKEQERDVIFINGERIDNSLSGVGTINHLHEKKNKVRSLPHTPWNIFQWVVTLKHPLFYCLHFSRHEHPYLTAFV